jgi:hypothetical protein
MFYIMTPLDIGFIILGLGLWKGRKWARTSTIVWNFIDIAFLFFVVVATFGITNWSGFNNVLYLLHYGFIFFIYVPISMIIVITKINLYLYRPYVKSYFVRPKNKKHGLSLA